MTKKILILLLVVATLAVKAQHKEFECTDEWVQKIEKLAPVKPEVKPEKKRKILILAKHTGFFHWIIPHNNEVMKVLGEKTGAFEAVITYNIFDLEPENLKKYDAVVLNNSNPKGPRRDLFLDILDEDKNLSEKQKIKKAAKMEANLIKYVKKGGGLMILHGAIVMQNNSMAFSKMVGGSFDYHPPQQEVTLELVDPNHPLVKGFEEKPFVHVDEPYLFKNAYSKKNFRPILYMDTSKLTNKPKPIDEKIIYVSWIKKHGKGRVFYVSPSHNAQSFEDARLLKFYLDGTQYVLGDLECDDTPVKL
ncbi:MAG: ThuA domain-containing protein [Bacteroidota bacterium]